MARFRPGRTWIWPAIVAGHVLALLALLGTRVPPARSVEARLQVVVLAPRIVATVRDDPPAGRAQRPPIATAAPQADVAPHASAPGDRRAPASKVDWYGEGERVAGELGVALPPTACNPDGRPGSSLPPCPKAPREFEWRAEQPRVGLAGGVLPYVRVGKRCVVGLGFFGCGVGPLPKANDGLFAEMDHPDRPRSSVPE